MLLFKRSEDIFFTCSLSIEVDSYLMLTNYLNMMAISVKGYLKSTIGINLWSLEKNCFVCNVIREAKCRLVE